VFLSGSVFAWLVVEPAVAEPGADIVARAAATCTAQGAFDHLFGEKLPGSGFSRAAAGASWAPFGDLMMNKTLRTGRRVLAIDGTASFENSATSSDEQKNDARRLFAAIDVQIQATRRFAECDAKSNGDYVEYHSVAGGVKGYILIVSIRGSAVGVSCEDADMRALAFKEAMDDTGR